LVLVKNYVTIIKKLSNFRFVSLGYQVFVSKLAIIYILQYFFFILFADFGKTANFAVATGKFHTCGRTARAWMDNVDRSGNSPAARSGFLLKQPAQ